MAKNAALEGELGELHSLVCKAYKEALIDPETGTLRKAVDPRMLSNINKFLADNKIYQIPEPGSDISELDKGLRERKKRFGEENITDLATALALKEAAEG